MRRIYCIPQVVAAEAASYRVPRYFAHRFNGAGLLPGLAGVAWAWMHQSLGACGVLEADTDDAQDTLLAAQPDVVPFAIDLSVADEKRAALLALITASALDVDPNANGRGVLSAFLDGFFAYNPLVGAVGRSLLQGETPASVRIRDLCSATEIQRLQAICDTVGLSRTGLGGAETLGTWNGQLRASAATLRGARSWRIREMEV